MKTGKGNVHLRQGKGKLSGVNRQRLPYLANLIFGFGTTFRCQCSVFENIGKPRTKTGTLPLNGTYKRSCLPRRQLLIVLRMLHRYSCSGVKVLSAILRLNQ